MSTDPRIPVLVRARHEVDCEAWRRQPCPSWCGPNKADRATMERQAELWIPAFERAGFMLREGDDEVLLCGSCVCADCGGPFEAHRVGRCACGCNPMCEAFVRDSRLGAIRAAAEALTGELLAEAVAHAVWHALFAPVAEETTEASR